MYLTFKNTIVISMLIHSMVIFYIGGKGPVTRKINKRDHIVVDYVKLKEPALRVTETPKMEIMPNVEMKPAVSSPAPITPEPSVKEATDALAVKQARIKSTEDYINYYQLIRERIRQKLKDRYRNYHGEGDVCLIFILRSDGSLTNADVDPAASTSDRVLVDTAIRSLREAAPFASFPRALSLPQMSFTLTVSFKKR